MPGVIDGQRQSSIRLVKKFMNLVSNDIIANGLRSADAQLTKTIIFEFFAEKIFALLCRT